MKKSKFILHLVAALLMMASFPLTGAALNQVSHTATYDSSRIGLGTDTVGGVTYTTVSYSGLYNVGTPGMPSLPVELIRFSVPYNATNFTVTAIPTVGQTRLLGHHVYPLQSPDGFTPPDASVYQNGGTYPEQSAWVVDEGMMAGENHVVTVAVLPWIYSYTSGITVPDTLSLAGSVSLTLSYELTDNPTLQAIVRKGASLREKGYVRTCATVVNPDDVRANAASAVTPPMIAYDPSNPYPNDSVENPDTYLIITTPQLLESMKRLAALKRQEGMRVKVVTVSEAITDPIAVGGDDNWQLNPWNLYTDEAGKLRQYIRVHFADRGTEYVLLAGTDVPSRDDSDMFYSSLHGDWMQDKDYQQDLTVGRLLGSTTEQIDNYTDKLFRYELNPGRGDGSYLKDAFVLETSHYETEGGGLADGLEDLGMDATFIMNFDDAPDQPNFVPFTGSDLVSHLNSNHYGLMCTVCDGAPNHMRIYENPDNTEFNYLWAIDTTKVAPGITDEDTGNGLNCLLNRDYPMIYYACYGRTIPYVSVQGYGNGLNFGESFTTGKNYGGPAFIGYTKNVWREAARIFLSGFSFRLPIKGYNLSDAMAACRSSYFEDDNEKINYLGDPSLKMWTETPTGYSGIQVLRCDNSITVSGIPTNKTVVAYCDNDGHAGQLETSSSSVIINGVSPNSTVMVHKHNYLPYIAPFLIQNETISNSQYVIADEVKMGKSVDANRTEGNVTVSDGVEYEIEASGKIILGAGFKVDRGAFFATRKSCYK
jgi:hypothetical protein